MVGWEWRKIYSKINVFSPQSYQKVFSPKPRENWRKNWTSFLNKNTHVQFTWSCPRCSSSFLFSFFLFLSSRCCLFIYLFILFRGRLPTRLVLIYIFFFYFLLCFFFRCDFFSRYDFYYLINLGDWFFFFFLFIPFLVLIWHYF